MTLAFLGSVDARRVALLQARLREILDGLRGFEMQLDVVSAFPDERRARIVWAGARAEHPDFVRLAEHVREVAREFATLDEKKARLHVTLARLREPARLPRVEFTPRTLRVESFALFESLPGEQTSRYEVVERWPLTVHASSPAGSR